jgi:hypothetical protein
MSVQRLRGLTALLLGALVACGAPHDIVLKASSIKEARALASQSGGLILLDFWRKN